MSGLPRILFRIHSYAGSKVTWARVMIWLASPGKRLSSYFSHSYYSFTPAVELKEKGKKGKAVHFAEIDGPASERYLNFPTMAMLLIAPLSRMA